MKAISVRNKVAAILLLMSVLLTATSYAIQKLVVLPSFVKLEPQRPSRISSAA